MTIGIAAGLIGAVAMTGTGLEIAAGFGGLAMGLLGGLAILRPQQDASSDDHRQN